MEMQFEMWSPFHWFMMVTPFILAIVLYIIMRDKSFNSQRTAAIILGIILVFILTVRQIFMLAEYGVGPEVFPLQVCHFGNILLLIVAINRKYRTIGTIAWCLNFPAALVSVIFANGLENYDNAFDIQGLAYIFGHMLIVTASLYFLFTHIIQINFRTLLKAYIILFPVFLLSVVLNNWFADMFNETSNYFYSYTPEAGTPLETMYNLGAPVTAMGLTFNPVYLLVLSAAGAVVMFIMYVLAQLLYRVDESDNIRVN